VALACGTDGSEPLAHIQRNGTEKPRQGETTNRGLLNLFDGARP
jgi:hypothetical protein